MNKYQNVFFPLLFDQIFPGLNQKDFLTLDNIFTLVKQKMSLLMQTLSCHLRNVGYE